MGRLGLVLQEMAVSRYSPPYWDLTYHIIVIIYMERSHSWEANSFSASQHIPHCSFPCSEHPAVVAVLSLIDPIHTLRPFPISAVVRSFNTVHSQLPYKSAAAATWRRAVPGHRDRLLLADRSLNTAMGQIWKRVWPQETYGVWEWGWKVVWFRATRCA